MSGRRIAVAVLVLAFALAGCDYRPGVVVDRAGKNGDWIKIRHEDGTTAKINIGPFNGCRVGRHYPECDTHPGTVAKRSTTVRDGAVTYTLTISRKSNPSFTETVTARAYAACTEGKRWPDCSGGAR